MSKENVSISREELDRLLNQDAKAKKQAERSKYYHKRRQVKRQLIIDKAVEKGIVVTDKEVDARMKELGWPVK